VFPDTPLAAEDHALKVGRAVARSATSPVVHVAAAVCAMAAALVWIRTGRDSLYFQGRGLFDLPKAYLGIAALSVPMALGMLALMRRVGPRRARVLAAIVMAAAVAGFAPFARPGGGPAMTLFFMLVPLSFGVLLSVSWLLAAELFQGFDSARLSRAYGTVGAAAILGGVVAGAIGRLLAAVLEPANFLLLGAAGLVLAAVLMARSQTQFPPMPAAAPGAAMPALAAVDPRRLWRILREPYCLMLLAAGMATSLVGILVEFQFYLAAATSGNDGRENARFFANTYLVLNAGALVVQVALLPRIQPRFGVHRGLLVLPTILAAGASALLGTVTVFAGSLLRITEGGLKASIHRVSWEQAYLPVGAAQRPAVKILVDGAGARVAEGLAALLLFAWLELVVGGGSLVGRDIRWLTYVLTVACAGWVVVTLVLARRLRIALIGGAPPSPAVPLPES
jgi:ATP/ADP translocase